MNQVLVTGGAGYIGSHIVRELVKDGYKVVVVDNLECGHLKSLPKENIDFYKIDFGDEKKLVNVFEKHKIDAVMHLAAYSLVYESMKNPDKYFKNNVDKSIILLNTMLSYKVNKIVFSSSASIYGNPKTIPIKEDSPTEPINIYGKTKLAFEDVLKEYKKSYGIKFISLRYFNAAGADESGKIGEDHEPETHLIPIVLQTALGKRKKISIFGDDYPTKDGTCIRDYIHVTDIAKAHIVALNAIDKSNFSNFYNLGNGKGYSVKEVIETCKDVSSKDIPTDVAGKRSGDPAELVASYEKIKKELGWDPKYDLKAIIKTAWLWHKNHPDGYEK